MDIGEITDEFLDNGDRVKLAEIVNAATANEISEWVRNTSPLIVARVIWQFAHYIRDNEGNE